MRKQNAANACQSGGETSAAVQGPHKVADANPTPIITVTTPSTGSGIFPSPKKVSCIKMMFPKQCFGFKVSQIRFIHCNKNVLDSIQTT